MKIMLSLALFSNVANCNLTDTSTIGSNYCSKFSYNQTESTIFRNYPGIFRHIQRSV